MSKVVSINKMSPHQLSYKQNNTETIRAGMAQVANKIQNKGQIGYCST